MWPKSLNIDVSRETIERLEIYHALLLKWQKAINLVSPATVKDAWVRHFADSAQILPLLPDTAKVYADIGCGGGFPGLVLAMMRPELEVHLIESDTRKCEFMRTVARETGVAVHVHAARIEAVDIPPPDVVSARALADLLALLNFIEPWAEKENFRALFMKGERWAEEVDTAQCQFSFEYQHVNSVTDPRACILSLGKISALHG